MYQSIGYGDVHRFFLRTIMNRGVISEKDAEKVIENHSLGRDRFLKDIVDLINVQILPMQQRIKWVKDETSGARSLVFVSSGCGPAGLAQGHFTTQELLLFRRILEAIAVNERKSICKQQAVSMGAENQTTNMTIARVKELLDEWEDMYYLLQTPHGYTLGLRSIHEFQQYLQENLPGSMDPCHLCHQPVFLGVSCVKCDEPYHRSCLKKYSVKISKWPCCKMSLSPADMEPRTDESCEELFQPIQAETSNTMDDSEATQETSQATRTRKRPVPT